MTRTYIRDYNLENEKTMKKNPLGYLKSLRDYEDLQDGETIGNEDYDYIELETIDDGNSIPRVFAYTSLSKDNKHFINEGRVSSLIAMNDKFSALEADWNEYKARKVATAAERSGYRASDSVAATKTPVAQRNTVRAVSSPARLKTAELASRYQDLEKTWSSYNSRMHQTSVERRASRTEIGSLTSRPAVKQEVQRPAVTARAVSAPSRLRGASNRLDGMRARSGLPSDYCRTFAKNSNVMKGFMNVLDSLQVGSLSSNPIKIKKYIDGLDGADFRELAKIVNNERANNITDLMKKKNLVDGSARFDLSKMINERVTKSRIRY